MKSGKFDGEGQFSFSNGSNYFGNFKEHMRHGEGMMLDDTQVEIFSGEWVNDKPSNKDVQALVMKMPRSYIILNNPSN